MTFSLEVGWFMMLTLAKMAVVFALCWGNLTDSQQTGEIMASQNARIRIALA